MCQVIYTLPELDPTLEEGVLCVSQLQLEGYRSIMRLALEEGVLCVSQLQLEGYRSIMRLALEEGVLDVSQLQLEGFHSIMRLALEDGGRLLNGTRTFFLLVHPPKLTTLHTLHPTPWAEMKAAPFETKSDSFYFVGNKMVMHNKAEYAYTV
jgi:hypothetical protein